MGLDPFLDIARKVIVHDCTRSMRFQVGDHLGNHPAPRLIQLHLLHLTSIRQCRIVEKVIAEIVSLSRYESQVSALMDEEERMAMEFFIACAPLDHPIIPGAGGFRKARWARRGHGKSGGFRVIYFFIAEPGRIYMASIYAKSRTQNLSAADRNLLGKIAAQIKNAVKGDR